MSKSEMLEVLKFVGLVAAGIFILPLAIILPLWWVSTVLKFFCPPL